MLRHAGVLRLAILSVVGGISAASAGQSPRASVREIPTILQGRIPEPVIPLPPPSGPFRVGRMSFHAVDSSRSETMTADSTDRRELVFHVWYPADSQTGSAASFIEVEVDDSGFRRSYGFIGIESLPRVRAHSLAAVPVSRSLPTYPVILFSHGLGTVSRLYTSLLEHLASHGFIVVGVDHPYFSAAFRLPNGRMVRNLSRQADRQRHVLVQARDLSFVATVLEQLQAPPAGVGEGTSTRLAGRMDLNRLGVFGHSRGGFAAPHACREDRRFRACVNLDGYEMTPQVMDSGIPQPFLLVEEAVPWAPGEAPIDSMRREAMFARMTGGAYLLTVSGAVHNSFSSMALIAPHRFPGARIEAGRAVEIMNAYLLAFFDTYLRGGTSGLLRPGPQPYPEVSLRAYPPGGPLRGSPLMPPDPPARRPPDREAAQRRMDRYLEAAQNFGFSGAVLVADRQGIVLRKGYGPADRTRRVAADMLFDMGSITKQFTAAAILLLEADGRLATTDSVGRFFAGAPADKRGITLHQLLTHTAGLISDFAGDYDQVSRDSALRAIFAAPLVAPPGREFRYSNAGFSLLAMVIEQVTGQTYDRFMQERVFGPAGMRSTGYRIPSLDSARVARTYTPPVDQGTPAERLNRAGGPGWNLKGNGGLLTTVDDLYRYELALRAGRPIHPVLQARQFAEQFRRSENLAHGYDWWILPDGEGGVLYDRAGDAPSLGVSADYRRYARDSTVFILLANSRHNGGSTRTFIMPNLRRQYLGTQALAPPVVRAAPAPVLDSLAGRYEVDSTSYFVVARTGGRLSLSAIGQSAVDVMVFNRDSNSIRNRARLNDRAAALIVALNTADTAALRTAVGSEADLPRTLHWWGGLSNRLGGFRRARVLGTGRLDRGVFISTVQVCFRDSVKTLRWALPGLVPTVSSEDASLPGRFPFGAESPVPAGAWSPYWWMQNRDTLVTYDLAFNSTLTATVIRRPDGIPAELVFHLPSGTVRARRAGAIRAFCPSPGSTPSGP